MFLLQIDTMNQGLADTTAQVAQTAAAVASAARTTGGGPTSQTGGSRRVHRRNK